VAFEQLYDLVFDPNEASNLVEDPAYAQTVAQLRAQLERWMLDTEDPLLHGDPLPPRGAEINDPDQISPGEPLTRIT
jgi:hypothetical protein